MKRPIVLLVLVLIASLPAIAKPKVKKYNNSPRDVFEAALRTARERHVVTFVDEKNLMFTFETGMSMVSYGFIANASVEADGTDKCKLIINVQDKSTAKGPQFSWGAGGRMADKFFEQVTQELARDSQQKVSAKPEEPPVTIPSSATSTAAATDTGTVDVTSDPAGADVSVGGAFVGDTPASLKLAAGKHSLTITENGFATWTRTISVLAGSDEKLHADLEKK